MPQLSTRITLGGQPVEVNVPQGTEAWRKANCIFSPVGSAPTRGWFVMTASNLAQVNKTAPIDVVWGQSGFGAKTLTFKNLYVLKSTRLLQGGVGDPSALYLVEVADARYLNALNSDTGEIVKNIRSYANSSDYLTGTSGATWTSLVEDLWGECEGLGAYPGLPYNPDSVPENNWLVGMNAWAALCAVLDQLDCAIAHNPLAGTYSIVQLGANQTIPAESTTLKWNAEPAVYNSLYAATIRVYFRTYLKSYGQERDTELANNWVYNGNSEYIDETTNLTGAVGRKALWDDMPWIIGEAGTQTNSSATATRATNRKNRYVTRNSVTTRHRVHIGLLSTILPGAQVRAVLWRNWSDHKSQLGGTVTEFIAGSQLVTGFHKGTDEHCLFLLENDQVFDNYSPPDLNKGTFPNYPRLPNIVQVVNTGSGSGENVNANSDGYHKGKVRRWVNGSMATLDDCWILFVDDFANVAGQVEAVNYDFYGPARLSGIATSSAETLPVYVVRKGGQETGPRLTRFKLTENMYTGDAAEGVKRIFNGTTYVDGDAIMLVDWWGWSAGAPGGSRGMFQAITGMEGWAYPREVNGIEGNPLLEFDIVWMEQYARGIEFTLTEDMGETTPGEASATVTASWEQGVAPGASIIVHDDQDRWPDAITGCKGTAWRDEYADIFDPATPYYRVVSCTRACKSGMATLTDNMCVVVPAIDNWDPNPVGEHQVDPGAPAGGTILNTFEHRALNGDTIWVERVNNTKPFLWIITNVTKHVLDIVVDRRIYHTEGTCEVQVLRREIAIETCEPPPDPEVEENWETELSLSSVDMLMDVYVVDTTIMGIYIPTYVFCTDEVFEAPIHVGTECDTGSGSGSGG